MIKKSIKIELNDEDLKEILAKEFNLKLDTMIMRVIHYQGDQHNPEQTTIIIESEHVQPLV